MPYENVTHLTMHKLSRLDMPKKGIPCTKRHLTAQQRHSIKVFFNCMFGTLGIPDLKDIVFTTNHFKEPDLWTDMYWAARLNFFQHDPFSTSLDAKTFKSIIEGEKVVTGLYFTRTRDQVDRDKFIVNDSD